MPSDRSVLERQIERVELRPFTLEGFHRRRERKLRNRRIGTAVVALVVAAAALGGLVRAFTSGSVPASDPRSPLLGAWRVASDSDGSRATMIVGASGDDAVQIELHDDSAPACSGARSTMSGTGEIRSDTELVIPSPDFTCDGGSQPDVGLHSLEEELRDFTFVYLPAIDGLLDPSGNVWLRLEPMGDASAASVDGTWPQTTPEQIREAQRLADEGDPDYTWQVAPELASGFGSSPGAAEIFGRFLREQLGWESFIQNPFVGGDAYGGLLGTGFIRCAPGQANTLYPDDPRAGTCAPTIDGFRYETVSVDVAQLGVQGPSGVWVVTGWRNLPPFQQLTPPSEAEATALLEAFLEARVDGEGAEEYLQFPEDDVPLMYGTTAGAPYERSEFELVDGPDWPNGWMEFRVRLLAEGGKTVVEQRFFIDPDATGPLGLLYDDPRGYIASTTENGQPVAVPYNSFLHGEVTFWAAVPWKVGLAGWDEGPTQTTLLHGDRSDERVALVADPRPVETGCHEGPAPADAEALARSIRSDPDLEATAPVAVSLGGTEALRMDVVAAPGASVCDRWDAPQVVTAHDSDSLFGVGLEDGHRMRLYLLSLPEGLSAPIMAIAIVAPEPRLELVVEAAAPILDSLEFHTG
jgi:hypothetical protein